MKLFFILFFFQYDIELKFLEEFNFIRGMWMLYFGLFMFEFVQSIGDGVYCFFLELMLSIISCLLGKV